jgi:hypothetical protein
MVALKSSVARFGGERALRWFIPWMWPIYVARGALAIRKHVADRLTERQVRRFFYLLRRSKGRPSNLTARQRQEFKRLLDRVEPFGLAKAIAAEFSPLPWPKAPVASQPR